MKVSTSKRIVYQPFYYSLLAVCLSNSAASIAGDEYIFDWNTKTVDSAVEGVTPSPWFRGSTSTPDAWKDTVDEQLSDSDLVSTTFFAPSSPHEGTGGHFGGYKPEALADLLTHIHNQDGYLDFVFSDYECPKIKIDAGVCIKQDVEDSVVAMVNLVRGHSNTNINDAYIGQYGAHPSQTHNTDVNGNYDRSDAAAMYERSSLNVAMPIMYPDYHYERHHRNPSNKHPIVTTSVEHALFWAPLERFSEVVRDGVLPQGHLVIPWIGGWVDNNDDPDDATGPVPSKTELRSLLQHARLRGADGYYTWEDDRLETYNSQQEFRDDMYAQGWSPLNSLFAYPGNNVVLNTDTDKAGGLEWSGVRRGNRTTFLLSNYSNSGAQSYPLDGVENMPSHSEPVANYGHQLLEFVVGPLHYWKFEDNGGAKAYEHLEGINVAQRISAGDESDGDIDGAMPVSGVAGDALKFDGAAGVSFGSILDLQPYEDRTFTFWFKSDSQLTGSYQTILAKGSSATNSAHTISLYNGKLHALMKLDNSGNDVDYRIVVSDPVNNGEWHHAAVSINRQDTMRMYIDGEFVGETDVSNYADVAAHTNGKPFTIGQSDDGQHFNGELDEVKVFGGVLSEQDIFNDYSAVLIARLDRAAGNGTYDDSKSSHIGQRAGHSQRIDGVLGKALHFDASPGQGIDYGDVLDLGTADRSIALWFRPAPISDDYEVLLSKGYSGTANTHAISMKNGKLIALNDINSDASDFKVVSDPIVDDKWYHAVIVLDRDGLMSMYIDGALVDTDDISTESNEDVDNNYKFYLGRSHKGQFYSGDLDEVILYDRALTLQQVQALYNSYQ